MKPAKTILYVSICILIPSLMLLSGCSNQLGIAGKLMVHMKGMPSAGYYKAKVVDSKNQLICVIDNDMILNGMTDNLGFSNDWCMDPDSSDKPTSTHSTKVNGEFTLFISVDLNNNRLYELGEPVIVRHYSANPGEVTFTAADLTNTTNVTPVTADVTSITAQLTAGTTKMYCFWFHTSVTPELTKFTKYNELSVTHGTYSGGNSLTANAVYSTWPGTGKGIAYNAYCFIDIYGNNGVPDYNQDYEGSAYSVTVTNPATPVNITVLKTLH